MRNIRLNDNDYRWVQSREPAFRGNNKLTKGDIEELFAILRRATGVDKGSTRCGRCVSGARSEVWKIYLSQRDNPDIITD